MSEMSGAGTVEWSENAALLEKRANSAEKQVTSSTLFQFFLINGV
jgi:hypothetical protein